MRNYFKSTTGQLHFFHDTVPESAEGAFFEACLDGEMPSIYQPTPFSGPWDTCQIIGHRSRSEVLSDLSNETDEELILALAEELAAIEARFADVGRTVPLQAVAA